MAYLNLSSNERWPISTFPPMRDGLPSNQWESHLQLGQLVVRVEQALELDLVEDVQDLGSLGQVAALQGQHALQTQGNDVHKNHQNKRM